MSANLGGSAPTLMQSPLRNLVLSTRCLPREKSIKSLTEPSSRAAKIKWTGTMDQVLFDTLIEKIALGRKADNNFKREAHQAAANEVHKRTQILVTWQNVQSRLRYHKREYGDVKDMLAASGFGWDSERMVVMAPDDVWDAYLKSHPPAERLCDKRIERMNDLVVIVGSDQATGRYAQGSRNIAASSSRVYRHLNESLRELDDDTDATVDLSEEILYESSDNYGQPINSQTRENRSFQDIPNRRTEFDSSRGGSATTKRMRLARPCDVVGMSLMSVADVMRNFRLEKEVNRTSRVLDILEEVQGLTNAEFIEVGQLLNKDEKLASFFVALRPEHRIDWLKKTLSDLKSNDGSGFV